VGTDSLLATSTYGSLTFWKRDASGTWGSEKIEGHKHSVFGLAVAGNLILSGDYGGDIMISTVQGESLVPSTSLSTSRVQNIALGENGSFATISKIGSLRFFEYDTLRSNWSSPIDVATATSEGKCVHLTGDGQSVLAGTETELIQFDVQSQLIQRIPTQPIVEIFSTPESVFVLTNREVARYSRSPAQVPLSLVKYKFAKISLVGHTEVGKTSFCKNIFGEDIHKTKSTIGRNVRTWIPDPTPVPERRIALYDHGGQETVLGTFIPFVVDSDVILVFFSQRELYSWTKAAAIIENLTQAMDKGAKIILVRTHIDEFDEVRDLPVERLKARFPRVLGPYRVDNIGSEGIDELKAASLAAIDWDRVRTVFQSETNQAVESVIQDLRRENADIVSLNEIRKRVEKKTLAEVTLGHLTYLLQNLAVDGSIEFYPKIIESVIFNDKDYNRLKSEIPSYVAEHDGIVNIDEILARFTPDIFVKMLDKIHTEYDLSVKNNGVRLYPGVLSNRRLEPPLAYGELLKKPSRKGVLVAPMQRIEFRLLFRALSELKLQCVGVTAFSGLFAWERNACLYYTARTVDDPLNREHLAFEYLIGGTKELMCDRLDREFNAIVRQLYGELRLNESA